MASWERNGTGYNLPPGCRECDIPGNRPEDIRWERAAERVTTRVEWACAECGRRYETEAEAKRCYQGHPGASAQYDPTDRVTLYDCGLCPEGHETEEDAIECIRAREEE